MAVRTLVAVSLGVLFCLAGLAFSPEARAQTGQWPQPTPVAQPAPGPQTPAGYPAVGRPTTPFPQGNRQAPPRTADRRATTQIPTVHQRAPVPSYPPGGPNQPVQPNDPTLRRTDGAAGQPWAPFRLTPEQEAYVDQILVAWERRSADVKKFECKFTRWEYDPVFGDPTKPRNTDHGEIKYGAPDQGRFEVFGERAEKWISDGKSIFEFNFATKQLIQHKLPPDLQGKAIRQSPLPFLFGSEAGDLKNRYFLRNITPPDVKDQVWLEAVPKTRADAANFRKAHFVLTVPDMTPYYLRTFDPNGKSHTAYQFYEIKINDPLSFLRGNPFYAFKPLDWKKVVEEPPSPQAAGAADSQRASLPGGAVR